LSTSESSRQSAIEHLRFDQESVINISAAANGEFSTRNVSPSRERAVRERYALERPFVMCTAGMEHGNYEAMIRAYARLPDEISQRHQLAIVGTVLDDDRSRLADLAQRYGLSTSDLVFTGFVAEDHLVDIYNLCKISAVPSWHDPIGLSALEAMSCGAPIVGAKASSLPEVIGRDDALFNPHDDNDITAKRWRHRSSAANAFPRRDFGSRFRLHESWVGYNRQCSWHHG
jgi:glycosyltransferase involved in cell wall biosynthesis